MAPLTAIQIKSFYEQAVKQIAAGQFDPALKLLQQIVETNPKIAEAHFQVGRLALESARPHLAFKPLHTATRLKPGESAIWRLWAEAVALGGRQADEEEFLTALKAAPLNPLTKIELQDRFGAHKASSRRSAGSQETKESLALVSLMRGQRYEEAGKRAKELLIRFPKSAVAANVLGGAQTMLGEKDAGLSNFLLATQLDPGYAEAYDNVGRAYFEQNKLQAAAAQFRKAITLTPYLVSALVNYGVCLARLGHASAAIVPLERAVATAPDPTVSLVALGNAHTRARNYAKAEEVLVRAVEVSGGKSADALAMLAQAQSRLGKDELALVNFEAALALDPNSPIATGGKATTLQTLGRFDEAESLFRRAFDLDPTNGENFRSFIASHKTKPGDPVIDMMLERYKRSDLSDVDRLNMAFAIAKALEDVKEYDRVFTYLDQANAYMRRLYSFDINLKMLETERLKKALDNFDWFGFKVPEATDFAPIFVTGMPRSGTTLVEQIISSHSLVEGAGEIGKVTQQMVQLLSRGDQLRSVQDINPSEFAALGREFEDYIRQRIPDFQLISDKSIQTYMYIGLVKLALPNARIIVVRRDPRDTLLSMYKNKFPDGAHLAAYDQRDLAMLYATFDDLVRYWRERVPDWFYEVEYEKLVADPEPETRKLIEACGLPWEDACLSPQDNDRKVETLSLFQVRQPITKSSVKGWKRFEKDLAPMLDELRKRGLVSD